MKEEGRGGGQQASCLVAKQAVKFPQVYSATGLESRFFCVLGTLTYSVKSKVIKRPGRYCGHSKSH